MASTAFFSFVSFKNNFCSFTHIFAEVDEQSYALQLAGNNSVSLRHQPITPHFSVKTSNQILKNFRSSDYIMQHKGIPVTGYLRKSSGSR